MTVAEVYGRIGAAKAFSSNVSNALLKDNENEITKLTEEESKTTDPKKKQKIQKKIKKRIKRQNKMVKKKEEGSTSFLVKLANYLDISLEVIIKFVAKYIVYSLPALEVGVKMLLLSNIKKMVSCAIDPRIPEEWRTQGIILNESLIDPRQILNASPFTRCGRYLYFGVYEKNDLDAFDKEDDGHVNLYQLTRAKDMNAFLWFTKSHGKFASPNIVNDINEYFNNASSLTLYETDTFEGKVDKQFVAGSLFKHSGDTSTLFLCTDRTDDSINKTFYTIIPVSDVWTGVTWYKDTNNLLGKKADSETIDYSKSKPLFNIEYFEDNTTEYPGGNFRFRIMPKPFSTAGGFLVDLQDKLTSMQEYIGTNDIYEVFGNEIMDTVGDYNFKFEGIQSPIPYEAKFNCYGQYDKKGIYSINQNKYRILQEPNDKTINYLYFQLIKGGSIVAYLRFDKRIKTFDLVGIDRETVLDGINAMEYLTECYNGKTVYEFNYDYVMSMKLFDEQSIAINLVNSLMNVSSIPSIPFPKIPQIPNIHFVNYVEEENSIKRNIEQIKIDLFVDNLVRKMIETEEYEFTDCFYNFSNEDYESMENDVAKRIINNNLVIDNSDSPVKQVYDIISAYDADASLNSRTETINLAILKATEACGYDTNVGNASSNLPITDDFPKEGGDFIQKIIQFLISSIVNALLTPKVIMLIQVNRMMMGMDILPKDKRELVNNYKFGVEDLLNGLSGLLKGVIREIINNIQTQILKLILERLNEIVAQFMKRLGIEFAMKWVNIIKQIFGCLSFGGRGGSSSQFEYGEDYMNAIGYALANVDYADIDPYNDEIIPQTNPC